MIETLAAGMGRPRSGYRRPFGWYYYAKKSVPIFPGIAKPRSARFLQRYYAQKQESRNVLDTCASAITYALFNAWIPFRARQIARRYNFDHVWAVNARRIAQLRFADPNDIALFRIADPAELDDYLRRFEHSVVNKTINPRAWLPECVLANKVEFYARCVAFSLSHPHIYATSVDGAVRIHAVPEPGNLIVKPAGGEGGDGVALANYQPQGANSEETFRAFLETALPEKGIWVVQQRMTTHADLATISLSALPTARITTMINERNEPEVVTSVLRFASVPSSLVDNIKAGGLMAPINLQTGRLGSGCKGRGVEDFTRHPTTGETIEGLQIPHWPEALALVAEAHGKAFREYVLVGWDIGLTPEGPVLIEGNGKPCMIVAQRAPRKGVGKTRFGDLLEYHLLMASN